MDGGYGRRVRGPHANLGAAWTIGRLIGDPGVASRHHGGARNDLGMDPEWPCKVPGSKRDCDITHVLADRGDPRSIGGVVRLQDDPPTILEILKHVGRGVLIHSHDRLTASLHGGKGTVRLTCRFTATPARGERDHGDEGGVLHDATYIRSIHGARQSGAGKGL